MNLNQIINAWENNALPTDVDALKACKREIDNCELRTFETWRMTSNRTTSSMLMNEQIQYGEISEAIQKRIDSLIRQKEYHNIINKPLFTSQPAY